MIGRRAALLCVALSLPLTARAKTSLQGQLTLSAGWTDNILGTPSSVADQMKLMTGPPQADWFFQVRPALILSTGLPRLVQTLAYTFSADLFATHSEANSYASRLDWNALILTSRTTELLLRLSFNEGRLSTFNLSNPSALTMITPTVAQPTTFAAVTASEQLVWDISNQWRYYQTLLFNGYWPILPRVMPDTYDIDQHIVIERGFRRDALALDLKYEMAIYSQLDGFVPDMTGKLVAGVVAPEQDVQIVGAVLRWRHDYGHFFSSQADLGFVETNRANGAGQPLWAPAALAAIRYLRAEGSLELRYSHLVTPNALASSTFVGDAVALSGGLPLGPIEKTHLALSLGAGYQYSQGINYNTGGALSHTHVILADASLFYNPRREITIYARYQFTDQIGNVGGDDPAPLASYHKQTVMLGVTGILPGQAAAVVPGRQALRVDRGDAVTIPEPHHDAPKY